MTEHQAPWIESDGVSNLPTVVGMYQCRVVKDHTITHSFFDGATFLSMRSDPEMAARQTYPSENFVGLRNGKPACNAWRDYQGLMSKPTEVLTVSSVTDGVIKAGQKIMTGNHFSAGDGGGATYVVSVSSPVMASDEPGIQHAAYVAKYEAKQDGPTIIHGVTVDPVAFEAFLESQRPKPIPNNTPRGIMTVWNERADHRLGMWNGNIAD